MGYRLEKLKRLHSNVGEGFSGLLYKNDEYIASVENKADGLEVNINLNLDASKGDTEHKFYFVLDDMKECLDRFRHLPSDSMCFMFEKNMYSAIRGFSELVFELGFLEMSANKFSDKFTAEDTYILGIFGSTWLTPVDLKPLKKEVLLYSLGVGEYAGLLERGMSLLKKNEEKSGPLVAVALLQGKYSWDLGLDDLVNLLTV